MNKYNVVLNINATKHDTGEREQKTVSFPVYTFINGDEDTQLKMQITTTINYVVDKNGYNSDYVVDKTIQKAINDDVHLVSDSAFNELQVARQEALDKEDGELDFLEAHSDILAKMPSLCEWLRGLPTAGDENTETRLEAMTDAFKYIIGASNNFDIEHPYYVLAFPGNQYLVIDDINGVKGVHFTNNVNEATHFYTEEEASVWENPITTLIDVRTMYQETGEDNG